MLRKQNNHVWYEDICKYYNITPQQAYELSERKKHRKPSLPGSKTCKPVSNMTFEELINETTWKKPEIQKINNEIALSPVIDDVEIDDKGNTCHFMNKT